VKSTFREETALPSLFWRIDEAEQARQSRGTSISVYRAEVLRNLRWLLNASAHPVGSPIWDLPEASSSVLNFGIPPYTGRMGSAVNSDDMARAIREAIMRFEPRILAGSLEVESLADPYSDKGNSIAFRISGSIWSQPVPERFAMETSVDTASGAWTFDV
jgi:type VI secretion system protein ImpF